LRSRYTATGSTSARAPSGLTPLSTDRAPAFTGPVWFAAHTRKLLGGVHHHQAPPRAFGKPRPSQGRRKHHRDSSSTGKVVKRVPFSRHTGNIGRGHRQVARSPCPAARRISKLPDQGQQPPTAYATTNLPGQGAARQTYRDRGRSSCRTSAARRGGWHLNEFSWPGRRWDSVQQRPR